MQDSNKIPYQLNVESLLSRDTVDLKHWSEFYKILVPNKNIVDRTNILKMPYNIRLYPPFGMPPMDCNFNKSFKEICLDRAKEILKKQEILKKPMYLFYSGGIDSTLVLVSLLMVEDIKILKEKIFIVMTQESISEYFLMYHKIIRPNFKILSADKITELFDGSGIILTGSQGDKIFGTDKISEIYRMGMFDRVFDSLNDFVVKFWEYKGIEKQSADVWFDLIKNQSLNFGIPLETNFDFLWWFNFNFEWQSEYFLFSLRSNSKLTEEYHTNFIFAFFDSEDFQQWSMNNRNQKIKESWNSYKFPAKDIIFEYTRDADYRDYKIKIVSAGRLFQNKTIPLGLDTDFNLITNIDKNFLYQHVNSFS
jgi:hypothetical protein